MYELAFALAEAGHDVELRGCVSRPVFAELAAHTTRRPVIDVPRRRPTADETVVLLEGFVDPLAFASIAFSAARPVLVLLAPPGLMGWSFEQGWTLPDPLTVDLASINRPSSYRAMRSLGFELWTHSHGITASAEAAGVPCRWVGQGSPIPDPDPVPKTYDVAIVGGNRWEPLARQVLEGLQVTTLVTNPGSNASILDQLGAARLLVHPMRVEGTSRLAVEARLMQTVPVVLDHPFGAGFSRDEGVVAVGSVGAMRHAVRDLLAAPDEVLGLAAAGAAFARRWRSWSDYRSRVARALEDPVAQPGAGARAAVGDSIDAVVAGARTEQQMLRRSFREIEAHARALEVEREAVRRHINEDLLPRIGELERAQAPEPEGRSIQ